MIVEFSSRKNLNFLIKHQEVRADSAVRNGAGRGVAFAHVESGRPGRMGSG